MSAPDSGPSSKPLLDGDLGSDVGVGPIVYELEILVTVVEDRGGVTLDHQRRQWKRLATQLLLGLSEMVEVEVRVADRKVESTAFTRR